MEIPEKSKKHKFISTSAISAIAKMEMAVFDILKDNYNKYDEIIFLCIGTDRSTGDSLGPLVGYKLSRMILNEKVYVFGTIDEPVHAKNITSYIKMIENEFISPFIIAIDAALGNGENINCISVSAGSLSPGAAVRKKLPQVGNAHITGIVNTGGLMEFAILQNTRLSTVIRMSDIIVGGIILSLRRLSGGAELFAQKETAAVF
ncbi:MAG: spore protease YyaC [Firmicutes bacterium]|nr:spore protease YyaC [Bacillota bacterium]